MVESREHPIELRALGRTGLRVSRLGLGLAALGRPGYINLGHGNDLEHEYTLDAMQARAHRVLDAAWQGGVRYFDAARSYGEAESFLGTWLASRKIAPGDCTVGSKWGYRYTADWRVEASVHEEKEHSADRVRAQWPETRDRLGEHVGVYMIHSAKVEDGLFERVDLLEALAAIRAEGVALGLSTTGPRQAETLSRAMEVEVDGCPLFDVVQATWNLLERSAGPALRDAHSAGLGVIVKETLANGRLSSRNEDPEFGARRAVLAGAAGDLGVSIEGLALRACSENSWADVVLSGAATVDQISDNLRCSETTIDDATDGCLLELVEDPAAYWDCRSKLDWN